MPALGGILSTTGVATEASPALSGTPTGPTAAVDTNTTQLATTAYVVGQGYAKLASPTFTGTPAAPTASVDTNTTQVATTAFVLAQASAVGDGTPGMDGTAARGTSTHFARADHVHPTDTSRAPLASPTFTGTPAAPTAAVDTNTTQVATTAYVVGQAYAKLASPTFTGVPAAPTAAVDTSTTQVATTAYVVNQGYAKLASPTFTGTPSLPTGTTGVTQSAADSTTKLATTAFVTTADNLKANLASPTFTGTPAAPTAAVDTNTTQIATTAYVVGQGYAKLASPTFTGTVALPTVTVSAAITMGNGIAAFWTAAGSNPNKILNNGGQLRQCADAHLHRNYLDTAYADIYYQTAQPQSDVRLKKNIVTFENALARLRSIRGVTFDWKLDDGHSQGVIAQEIEDAFPRLVTVRPGDEEELKHVNYEGFVAPFIEAIKELADRLEVLEGKVA